MKIVPQSVELIDYMGSDISVVNAARVSFAKQSDFEYEYTGGPILSILKESDQKLIRYLATHNHWSPFAHAFLSFRIKAPIFVARQLVKHQVGLSWNEVSRRYVDDEPEYFLPASFRARAENVKQGSSEDTVERVDVDVTPRDVVQSITYSAHNTYLQLLAAGVAPEQARMVLPQNTMTEWVWSGSLMAFARVVKQRKDTHAQKETQEVAHKIQELVPESFNYSWKALIDTAN